MPRAGSSGEAAAERAASGELPADLPAGPSPAGPLPAGPLLGGTSYARVRDVIRQDIVAGTFAAGARLKAQDLARRYGVSPVPVREALQQLQGEGLVVIEPNRGASVRRIDTRFLLDVFEIREALAGLLAAKAAERMTPAIMAQLDAEEAAFEEALGRGDLREALRANGAFHRIGYAAAGNAEALALMDRHLALIQTLRLRVGFSASRGPDMVAEHRALLESLRAGQPRAAARHARRHIRGSHDDLMRQIQGQGPR